MKYLITSAIAALVLIGCASRAQMESDRLSAIFNKSNAESAICLTQLRSIPAAQIVNNEIIFYPADNPNKIALLTSTVKITNQQSKALTEYMDANEKCRKEYLANFAAIPQITAAIQRNYNANDIIFSKLLAKEITIGEANRAVVEQRDKGKEDYMKTKAVIWSGLQQDHDREMRAVQNMLNNMNPRITNCQSSGGSTNCTTY